jgi:hypothetical protein
MVEALKQIIAGNPEEVIMLLVLALCALTSAGVGVLWGVLKALGTANNKLESINTNLVAYIDQKHLVHQGQIDIITSKQAANRKIIDEHEKKLDNHSERIVGLEVALYPRKLKKEK